MSPAYEVARYLEAQGIGVFAGTAGWVISVSREPETPENAVTIYDTGGLEPDTDEMDVRRPTFQVRVRSRDYLAAYAKQEAIRDLLILVAPVIMEGTRYAGVMMSSDILPIGRDDGDRHLLTANYRAIRTGR